MADDTPPAGAGPGEKRPSKQVRDERTRLTATFLNTVAGGCVTAGVVAPTIALALAYPDVIGPRAVIIGSLSFAWLAAGIGVHFLARWVLKGIDR